MAPSDDYKDYEDQKQEKCPLSIPVELDQHQEDVPESQVVWATHKMQGAQARHPLGVGPEALL